jgi:mannose-1-phosphate guanylyltransferase/mannose-6-phosphate isomerase
MSIADIIEEAAAKTQSFASSLLSEHLGKLGTTRVDRPWGYFESLVTDGRFQVKRIVVTPQSKLSLQKHYHRSEHWVVVEGTALVNNGETETMLYENQSIYIPAGAIHRLSNPGRIPLTIIEIQVGAYLGEDDIIRLDDTYGRS